MLRILYACTVCRRIGDGDFYDLRRMFGNPIVCLDCAKEVA